MRVYLDTSAAVKLLVLEAESEALVAFLEAARSREALLVSSALLETELRRFATRVGLPQAAAAGVIARFHLADIDRALLVTAGLLPHPAMRSLDAIHVASALRLDVGAFVTYDDRQAAAAVGAGLAVTTPS